MQYWLNIYFNNLLVSAVTLVYTIGASTSQFLIATFFCIPKVQIYLISSKKIYYQRYKPYIIIFCRKKYELKIFSGLLLSIVVFLFITIIYRKIIFYINTMRFVSLLGGAHTLVFIQAHLSCLSQVR